MKVAYIQGRPGAHPMHRKFAETVHAEFHFVDFKMRWQDKQKSIAYRVLSWFVCAFTFPRKREYDVFLVDNLHFMPVIMKSLRLIGKKQKIVAHMGSHTLYFMYAHRFSKLTEYLHVQALKRYDALICEGKMAEELVKKILGNKTPKLYTVINGVPDEHFPDVSVANGNLDKPEILFVGHGPGKERLWYKGLDIMLDAFELARKKNPKLKFTVVGNWNEELKMQLISKYSPETAAAINFAGETNKLDTYYLENSLYLHCSRGEAYGLTVLIAMAYGLPALVSEWTGTREVVEQVSNEFIVELNPEEIAKRIDWYFNLSPAERKEIAAKGITIGRQYTEKRAMDEFAQTFSKLGNDFGLK